MGKSLSLANEEMNVIMSRGHANAIGSIDYCSLTLRERLASDVGLLRLTRRRTIFSDSSSSWKVTSVSISLFYPCWKTDGVPHLPLLCHQHRASGLSPLEFFCFLPYARKAIEHLCSYFRTIYFIRISLSLSVNARLVSLSRDVGSLVRVRHNCHSPVLVALRDGR